MKCIDFKKNMANPAIYSLAIASIALLVAMRCGRTFVSDLDLNIALKVKELYDLGELYLPAILNFCNANFMVLVIIPLLLPCIHSLVLGYALKRFSFPVLGKYALYQLASVCGFILLNTLLNLILKYALNRPRPCETLELAKDFDECEVNFVGFLYANSKKSECSAGFHSCPSGHTNGVASFLVGACLMQTYFIKHCKIFCAKTTSNHVWIHHLNVVLLCILIVLSVILIGSVALARILAFRHYFGDVTFAAIQVWMFGFLWQVFEPDVARLTDGSGEPEIEEVSVIASEDA